MLSNIDMDFSSFETLVIGVVGILEIKSKISLTATDMVTFSDSMSISGPVIFSVELSKTCSLIVQDDISKNLGTLYKIANIIGAGSRSDLNINLSFGWQQFKYRSIDILTVTATDPTLPICANPILERKIITIRNAYS